MDTYERAILRWLQEQPEPVTMTEIHNTFKTLTFSMLRQVLESLLSENKIEVGPPKGFMQTWKARTV